MIAEVSSDGYAHRTGEFFETTTISQKDGADCGGAVCDQRLVRRSCGRGERPRACGFDRLRRTRDARGPTHARPARCRIRRCVRFESTTPGESERMGRLVGEGAQGFSPPA